MSKGSRSQRRGCVPAIRFAGEEVSQERIAEIRRLVRSMRDSPRQEIARGVSRHFGWRQPSGALRVRACRDLLVRMEKAGLITLPAPQSRSGQRSAVTGGDREPAEARSPVGSTDVELRQVVVRPARPSEVPRFRSLMAHFHYLGDGELVGESLRYVAEFEGKWLALLCWGGAAWKSRHREKFIGWSPRQKSKRLHLVVNNARFLILPWVKVPRLGSRVLSANLRRLRTDWIERYGHPVLLAETFIDLERFRGTCYRAANWRYLGLTRGMGRKGRGYEAHGRPKGMFVYPLHRRATQALTAPFASPLILEPNTMTSSTVPIDVNRLPLEGEGGLLEALAGVKDPRKHRGIRHPFRSVLALAAMATLSGMKCYEAIAEWASDVPKETLRKLGCWCHRAPSESTFRRLLQAIDANEFDRVINGWVAQQEDLAGKGVALDGKTVRGSRDGESPACHLLAALTHETGVVVAQEEVGEKTNEITHAASTLEHVDLKGATITADAMHCQREFAKFLVDKKEADFVFIAKENQPSLLDDLRVQHDDGAFSPSGEDD